MSILQKNLCKQSLLFVLFIFFASNSYSEITNSEANVSEPNSSLDTNNSKSLKKTSQKIFREIDFNVYFNDIYLGEAKHTLDCADNKCLVISSAKPKGVASLLIKDIVNENSLLAIDKSNRLIWHKYRYQKLKNGKVTKEYFFERDGEFLTDKNSLKRVLIKENTFDLLSIVYALHWDKKFHSLINQEYQVIEHSFYFKNVIFSLVEEAFFSINDKKVRAVHYEFKHPKANMSIWLVPSWEFLPIEIEIYNKKKGTITKFIASKFPIFQTSETE